MLIFSHITFCYARDGLSGKTVVELDSELPLCWVLDAKINSIEKLTEEEKYKQ